MGFAKGEALLRLFKRPQWFRSNRWLQRPQRPFIFPTGFGFAFGSLALVQLIMAVSSQNNLIYLFVFSEVAIALASMFFTNANINRIQISQVFINPTFAQEENWVEVLFATTKPVYQLQVRWSYNKEPIVVNATHTPVQIPWTPRRRGKQNIPSLIVESTFPFGLLRGWKVIRTGKEILVFPERKGNPAYPQASRGDRTVDQQGLFYDLRQFQKGDWPRRIDWRASQRTQQLMIRRFEEESAVQLDFHWEQTSGLKEFEDRISQLALWVDQAERQGAEYSLQVGNWKSGRSRGPNHWNRCFEFLALMEKELK